MREWVVLLQARSTIRLRDDHVVHVEAGPASTAPILDIRVRNSLSKIDDRLLVTGLFVAGRGLAGSAEAAVPLLASRATPYLHIIATAANGAIDEPKDLLAYAPPTASERGAFVDRRSCNRPYPAAVVRSTDAADLLPVLEALEHHPDRERLHRAMAHYRHALGQLDPWNRVMSAEALFLACENLGQVILRRLYREASLPDTGESKHQLAVAAGFNPPNPSSRQHLSNFDSHIRATYIFEGDDDTYRNLRFASEHFEHGSRSFDAVQAAAHASADTAFNLVRRTILRELGIADDSPLLTDHKYQEPLAGWDTTLQVSGTYSSDRADDWPYFYGLSLFPEIVKMEDLDDGRRNVTLRATGTGASLLDGQQVAIESTVWAAPLTSDRKVERVGEPEIIVTRAGDEPNAPTGESIS